MARRLASAYFAGAVAALGATLALWLLARADLLVAIGVSLAPRLGWELLASRVFAGSLWGLGLIAVRRQIPGLTRAALVLSLAPSGIELFVLMPEAGRGMLGVSYGALTPLVVLAANAFWGWLLALGVRRVEGGG